MRYIIKIVTTCVQLVAIKTANAGILANYDCKCFTSGVHMRTIGAGGGDCDQKCRGYNWCGIGYSGSNGCSWL